MRLDEIGSYPGEEEPPSALEEEPGVLDAAPRSASDGDGTDSGTSEALTVPGVPRS